MGILTLCLLAGLRSENIGTDIQTYTKPIYTAAKSANSFSDYLTSSWYALWRYKYVGEFEIGFTTLIYIVTKIFNSFFAVLFSIEFFIIVPIYFALKKLKRKVNIPFGMLVFCLMFYNVTLNIMRQWIAMAFVLYAFSCITAKEKKRAILSIIIGMLFHISAIISVPIYSIFVFATNRRGANLCKTYRIRIGNLTISLDQSMQRTLMTLIIGLLLMTFINTFASALRNIGLVEYASYITGDAIFSIESFIVRLPILMIFLKYRYIFVQANLNGSFYIGMFLFEILTSQLSGITSQSWRISAWFSMFYILSFPQLLCEIKHKVEKRLTLLLIIFYMIIYWIYYYIYIGSHATVPYQLYF